MIVKKRDVYVKLEGDSWRVLYARRSYRQRYAAAQFYAPDHSRQFVEEWVRKNPKLNLVMRVDVIIHSPKE